MEILSENANNNNNGEKVGDGGLLNNEMLTLGVLAVFVVVPATLALLALRHFYARRFRTNIQRHLSTSYLAAEKPTQQQADTFYRGNLLSLLDAAAFNFALSAAPPTKELSDAAAGDGGGMSTEMAGRMRNVNYWLAQIEQQQINENNNRDGPHSVFVTTTTAPKSGAPPTSFSTLQIKALERELYWGLAPPAFSSSPPSDREMEKEVERKTQWM